jgi:hypothetical protein
MLHVLLALILSCVYCLQFDIAKRPWFASLFNFSIEDTDALKENADPESRDRNKGKKKKAASAGVGVDKSSRSDKQRHFMDTEEDDSTLLPRVSEFIYHISSALIVIMTKITTYEWMLCLYENINCMWLTACII